MSVERRRCISAEDLSNQKTKETPKGISAGISAGMPMGIPAGMFSRCMRARLRERLECWEVAQASTADGADLDEVFADFHAMLVHLELPELLGACAHFGGSPPRARRCVHRCAKTARSVMLESGRAEEELRLIKIVESTPIPSLRERLTAFGLKPLKKVRVHIPRDSMLHAKHSDDEFPDLNFQEVSAELETKKFNLVCVNGGCGSALGAALGVASKGCVCARVPPDDPLLGQLLSICSLMYDSLRVFRGFDALLVLARGRRKIYPRTREKIIAAISGGVPVAIDVCTNVLMGWASRALPPVQPKHICPGPPAPPKWTTLRTLV